jgi:pilus assembly protein Flp/PilA
LWGGELTFGVLRGRAARRIIRTINSLLEAYQMNNLMLKLFVRMQTWMEREDGQDLVEYALVVAMVAFGSTASLKTLGTGVSHAFTNISSTLASSLT